LTTIGTEHQGTFTLDLGDRQQVPYAATGSERRAALVSASGLGLACGEALLRSTKQPWHLIIASRDASEGEKAAAELNRDAGGDASPGDHRKAVPCQSAATKVFLEA